MNAKIRRRLEMGARALRFSREHLDPSPGYHRVLAALESLVSAADRCALQQRAGLIQVQAAALRKRELRRTMKLTHLAYLASLAQEASQEEPELAGLFLHLRASRAHLTFRTVARGIAAQAEQRKDLLERHGLAGPVLETLAQALDQFDEATEQLIDGRRTHVGASAELQHLAGEVVKKVHVLDGFNRIRFASDRESLAAWLSASKVLAYSPPAGAAARDQEQPASGGDIRPAA